MVVGGDGADWIRNGASYFKRSHFQLDAGKVVDYILNNHRGLAEYRLKEQFSDQQLRSLGAAEGNVDKSIANRIGKRGMAWTKLGARRMTRVLEAERNGVLENYLPKRTVASSRRKALRRVLRRQAANALPPPREPTDWLSAPWAVDPSSRYGIYAILRQIGKSRSIL